MAHVQSSRSGPPNPTLSTDLPWGVSNLWGSLGSFSQGTNFLPFSPSILGAYLIPSLEPLPHPPHGGLLGNGASEQWEVLRV